MNWVDIVILAVIGVSLVVSLFRGFIREVFSLFVWVLAIWLGLQFSGGLAGVLETWIELPSARVIIAFVAIFLAVLVVGGLVSYLLGRLVESTGLSATDRLIGGLFGALRGVAIVVVAVIVLSLTPFTEDPWWRESRLLPEFTRLAEWAKEFLPESVKEHLNGPEDATRET